MRFSIYARSDLEVERDGDRWVVYRRGLGVRRDEPTIFIPDEVHDDEIAAWLDDLLHEHGNPGETVRRVP